MEKSKTLLALASLLVSMFLWFPENGTAAEPMTINSVLPAATETTAKNYVLDRPVESDNVTLAWNFTKGMDAKFDQNILNISVQEKGSGNEIFFDATAGVQTDLPDGDLTITNPDFTYTKEGDDIRQLALIPTTVTFDGGKTYVVTVYDMLDNNTFAANNDSVLNGTFTFEFTTISFTATPGSRKVTLNWTTGDEENIKGFNIHRAPAPEGPFEKINGDFIPATGGDGSGDDYTYVDKGLRNRRPYYYRLIIIPSEGENFICGEAEETPLMRYFWQELIDFLKGLR